LISQDNGLKSVIHISISRQHIFRYWLWSLVTMLSFYDFSFLSFEACFSPFSTNCFLRCCKRSFSLFFSAKWTQEFNETNKPELTVISNFIQKCLFSLFSHLSLSSFSTLIWNIVMIFHLHDTVHYPRPYPFPSSLPLLCFSL